LIIDSDGVFNGILPPYYSLACFLKSRFPPSVSDKIPYHSATS
jgi:hypothetical protein